MTRIVEWLAQNPTFDWDICPLEMYRYAPPLTLDAPNFSRPPHSSLYVKVSAKVELGESPREGYGLSETTRMMTESTTEEGQLKTGRGSIGLMLHTWRKEENSFVETPRVLGGTKLAQFPNHSPKCIELETKSPYETRKFKFQGDKKAHIVGNVTISHLLDNVLDPPMDYDTFFKFCKSHYVEESVEFLARVRELKRTKDNQQARVSIKEIRTNFILPNSPGEVNICCGLRRKTDESVVGILTNSQQKTPLDFEDIRCVYNKAYVAVKRMVMMNKIVQKFVESVSVSVSPKLAKDQVQAFYRCNRRAKCGSEFSYPEPIDQAQIRLLRGLEALVTILALLEKFYLGSNLILTFHIFQLILRVVLGPRMDITWIGILYALLPALHLRGIVISCLTGNRGKRSADVFSLILLVGLLGLMYLAQQSPLILYIGSGLIGIFLILRGFFNLIVGEW
ncbi:hypothetical protein AAMO2058_001482400 [Amorphochlora amoebiformis]